ncbi:hypothetical protein RDI58_022455 [Solanum bulbocastanum]|uniref:Uncharacterized protein n=1 Tax=Solanum bulbocastanum TaxID=147425 RepID=A0AAN8T7T6_SOLBU
MYVVPLACYHVPRVRVCKIIYMDDYQ